MDKYKWLKDSFSVNILGNCLSPMDVVQNLGVLFDSKFSFPNHVNSVIKSCFVKLRDLHHIQCFLSYDMSVMVANALDSSRLDYCNSLFYSLSSKNIARLQNIQNCLARFVSGASRFSHVCPILKSLHWLPVKQRSLLLIYKFLITGKPKYKILHLLIRQDVVIQKRCSLKSPSIVPQFINLKFISTSPSHMMLQNSGMICHWKLELLLHYHISKYDLKPICFRSPFLLSFSYYQTLMIPW